MTLQQLIELVPDHAKIEIVQTTEKNQKQTLYTGYKCDFVKFCNFRCIFPAGYKVTSLYAGSCEAKNGLVVVVKFADDYEKKKRNY